MENIGSLVEVELSHFLRRESVGERSADDGSRGRPGDEVEVLDDRTSKPLFELGEKRRTKGAANPATV